MRFLLLLTWVGIGSFAVAFPVAANIIPSAPETAGGILRPLQDVDVALERERVEIVRGRSLSHRVVATFWLRSHATEPVELPVAFPLPIDPHHPTADRVAESFIVLVDGEPISSNASTDGPEDAPGWVTWNTRWAPGQMRVVTCVYDVEFPEPIGGLVRGTRIRYQVSTGRHWRGRIEEAAIRYRGLRPRWSGSRILPSYEDHVVERTKDAVVWRFTDWVPGDEDLTLEMVQWSGLSAPGYGAYVLPRPYSGADRQYDYAWLEELVGRELALPRRAFPNKVSALDRQAVRAWIARHLLMEIRARNGDPFILGKVGLLERLARRLGWHSEPPKVGLIRNGVRYSRWNTYFTRYDRSPGGSYDPDPSLQVPVGVEDLHGLERENAEFLLRLLSD